MVDRSEKKEAPGVKGLKPDVSRVGQMIGPETAHFLGQLYGYCHIYWNMAETTYPKHWDWQDDRTTWADRVARLLQDFPTGWWIFLCYLKWRAKYSPTELQGRLEPAWSEVELSLRGICSNWQDMEGRLRG